MGTRSRSQRRRKARRCKVCRKMFGGGGSEKPRDRACPDCDPQKVAERDLANRDWVPWMVGEPKP